MSKLIIVALALTFLVSTGCAGLLGIGGADVHVEEYRWTEFAPEGHTTAKKEGCVAKVQVDSKLLSGEILEELAGGCLDDPGAPSPGG